MDPAGNRAKQLCPSPSQASSPLTLPRRSAAQSIGVTGRCNNSPAAREIAATQPGAPKCKRPVARPAPYTVANKMGGRSLTTEPSELRRTSTTLAAGRYGDLAECLHHNDLDGSPALLLFETHLGHDCPFATRDIPRRHPIESVSHDVVAAQLAATE